MLYYGTIYCETEEKLAEIMAILHAEGFEVALQTQTSGTLVKVIKNESENKKA